MCLFINRKKAESQFDKPYIYVTVCFQMSSTPYMYRTTDKSIQVGDCVIVPAGDEDATALVVNVQRYSVTNVPYPVEKTKMVIRVADCEEKWLFENVYKGKRLYSTRHSEEAFQELTSSVDATWTEYDHLTGWKEYECSYCGGKYHTNPSRCPKCGARMTKTKYDPQWVDEIEMMDALFH